MAVRRLLSSAEYGSLTLTHRLNRYNENLRLRERCIKFNVENLKRLAATVSGRTESDVVGFRKLAEGGFNRTFEITMQDGLQLIARLPYRSTVPKHYAVASEVATMDFVRSYSIAVPRIYDYSTTVENSVGCEYIIMEKVAGQELGETWFRLSPEQRLKVIKQVVDIESRLFSIPLPANGSIYYKKDLSTEVVSLEIPGTSSGKDFCIGPSAQQVWWYKERGQLSLDRGPSRTSKEVLQAAGQREITWITRYAKARYPDGGPLHMEVYNYEKSSPATHSKSLSDYMQIAEHLPPSQDRFNRPILRHVDLQPNNIFVSDSMDVLGIIDWQHCSVLPMFLHAGIPQEFQNYGDLVSERGINPQLPDGLELLPSREQDEVRETHRRRQMHYFYMTCTADLNKDHLDALQLSHWALRQKLFQHAGTPWVGDSVTLKADLIQATRVWQQLASASDLNVLKCPIAYAEVDVEFWKQLESKKNEADDLMTHIRNFMNIDPNGWVSPEFYDFAKDTSQEYKAGSLKEADTDTERDAIENHWPFDNHDED
ncbi:MAG: hypothetical protein Q9220_007610 [cf. Caloplaca sp. 1 TL-2023]